MFICICVALSLSGLPCSMGFDPYYVLDWQCILSGILCRLLFWLLSGDIMRYNELFCEYFLCPMNLCNSAPYHPFVLVSSLTMQRGQSEVFVAFFSKIAQGTSVRRRDRGPSHKHVRTFGNSTFLQCFSLTLATLFLVDSKAIIQVQ